MQLFGASLADVEATRLTLSSRNQPKAGPSFAMLLLMGALLAQFAATPAACQSRPSKQQQQLAAAPFYSIKDGKTSARRIQQQQQQQQQQQESLPEANGNPTTLSADTNGWRQQQSGAASQPAAREGGAATETTPADAARGNRNSVNTAEGDNETQVKISTNSTGGSSSPSNNGDDSGDQSSANASTDSSQQHSSQGSLGPRLSANNRANNEPPSLSSSESGAEQAAGQRQQQQQQRDSATTSSSLGGDVTGATETDKAASAAELPTGGGQSVSDEQQGLNLVMQPLNQQQVSQFTTATGLALSTPSSLSMSLDGMILNSRPRASSGSEPTAAAPSGGQRRKLAGGAKGASVSGPPMARIGELAQTVVEAARELDALQQQQQQSAEFSPAKASRRVPYSGVPFSSPATKGQRTKPKASNQFLGQPLPSGPQAADSSLGQQAEGGAGQLGRAAGARSNRQQQQPLEVNLMPQRQQQQPTRTFDDQDQQLKVAPGLANARDGSLDQSNLETMRNLMNNQALRNQIAEINSRAPNSAISADDMVMSVVSSADGKERRLVMIARDTLDSLQRFAAQQARTGGQQSSGGIGTGSGTKTGKGLKVANNRPAQQAAGVMETGGAVSLQQQQQQQQQQGDSRGDWWPNQQKVWAPSPSAGQQVQQMQQQQQSQAQTTASPTQREGGSSLVQQTDQEVQLQTTTSAPQAMFASGGNNQPTTTTQQPGSGAASLPTTTTQVPISANSQDSTFNAGSSGDSPAAGTIGDSSATSGIGGGFTTPSDTFREVPVSSQPSAGSSGDSQQQQQQRGQNGSGKQQVAPSGVKSKANGKKAGSESGSADQRSSLKQQTAGGTNQRSKPSSSAGGKSSAGKRKNNGTNGTNKQATLQQADSAAANNGASSSKPKSGKASTKSAPGGRKSQSGQGGTKKLTGGQGVRVTNGQQQPAATMSQLADQRPSDSTSKPNATSEQTDELGITATQPSGFDQVTGGLEQVNAANQPQQQQQLQTTTTSATSTTEGSRWPSQSGLEAGIGASAEQGEQASGLQTSAGSSTSNPNQAPPSRHSNSGIGSRLTFGSAFKPEKQQDSTDESDLQASLGASNAAGANQNRVGQRLDRPQGQKGVSAADQLAGLRATIPGEPLADYPIYSSPPKTSFDCMSQSCPGGYYADLETQCQVFHICQNDGRFDTFLCPNGTIFSQQHFVCVWWWQVDCEQSTSFYKLNDGIYCNSMFPASYLLSPGSSGDGASSSLNANSLVSDQRADLGGQFARPNNGTRPLAANNRSPFDGSSNELNEQQGSAPATGQSGGSLDGQSAAKPSAASSSLSSELGGGEQGESMGNQRKQLGAENMADQDLNQQQQQQLELLSRKA